MTSELHAQDYPYSLSANGDVRLKLFVFKRISTVNLESRVVYLIRAALKVSIYNPKGININPGPMTEYKDYPALFSFTKTLTSKVAAEKNNFRLLSYAPITVNSAINTSRSDSHDQQLTNSTQQSVGSSTSQTNSFGVNVQGGVMMDMPMWSVGFSYEHAYAEAQSRENAQASGTSTGQQLGNVDSFSIKDWGIYASSNQTNLQAGWVCAQEYPWDVLQFRSVTGGTGDIEMPRPILDRMLIDDCVLPPSQLSLFGTDFTFTSDWSFTPTEENVDMDTPLVALSVDTAYMLGSHERTGTSPPYSLAFKLSTPARDTKEFTLTWWELECLALNALVPGRNDASLNLEKLPAKRFPTTTPLTVTSPTNTLLCVAKGFTAGMVADVATTPATYHLAFKVTDTVGEVSLYLKHWKHDAAAVRLDIKVNEFDLPAQYVDAKQGVGGMSNRTQIILRSVDYMAEDFCDYLKVGLNEIKVTVSTAESPPPATARYCLAAIVVS
ncbi:hypothetical protein MNR01_12350 [Lysobacter sp. S4-A87]|uniref:hypothetical protein n=1 Tax=Lysobacter sp. S4-A87 TaxID=2925843 RepID=UPI001F534C82|nr:hypothetical protein [Lysobacter sp. S4-A87]UNK48538.1 hypothetical protein MNR01_12350 [Lysobacter sp. S4-A87]